MAKLRHLLLASVIFAMPLFVTGCGPNRAYVWGPGEETYYVQWEHQTHRHHEAWEQRSDREHNQYWKWRKHHHD